MDSILNLPILPKAPMFDGEDLGQMTIAWQEFFRQLFDRVGGTNSYTNSELGEFTNSLINLSPSLLVATDSDGQVISVDDLKDWITGTVNQIAVTDNLDGTITLSLPQDIHYWADVEFSSLILGSVSDNRLTYFDSNKKLSSVANLASWVAGETNEIGVVDDLDGTVTIKVSDLYLINNLFGTTNQVIVTDNLDGSVTLSLPQDIHSSSSPTFSNLVLSGAKIDTQGTTPTDLEVDCGTEKTLRLTEVVWEDLRVPAQNTKLNPSKSEPAFVSWLSGLFQYRFGAANASDESIHFTVQLPHAYKEGTELRPHVHWSPDSTDTGNVVWELEYSISTIDGTFPSSTTINVTVAADGTASKHQVDSLPSISGTGLGVSSVAVCRLTRLGTDANDTFTGNAFFHEIDFHYQVDTMGSRQEFVK